jgi:hypothetical protein
MSKTSALELFNSLTLDEVRQQIAAVDEQIAALEKQRDSMRTIEKAIDIRDHGKPKKNWNRKKKAAPELEESGHDSPARGEHTASHPSQLPDDEPRRPGRQPSPETRELRTRLYQVLRLEGPMTVADLSRHVKVDYGKVQNALEGGSGFEKIGQKWNVKSLR